MNRSRNILCYTLGIRSQKNFLSNFLEAERTEDG